MSFSQPFIERPIGTTLLAVGLFLLGLVAYLNLPVASLPTVEFPTIRVTATLPGGDPETMAARVAAPLERRLGEIRLHGVVRCDGPQPAKNRQCRQSRPDTRP